MNIQTYIHTYIRTYMHTFTHTGQPAEARSQARGLGSGTFQGSGRGPGGGRHGHMRTYMNRYLTDIHAGIHTFEVIYTYTHTYLEAEFHIDLETRMRIPNHKLMSLLLVLPTHRCRVCQLGVPREGQNGQVLLVAVSWLLIAACLQVHARLVTHPGCEPGPVSYSFCCHKTPVLVCERRHVRTCEQPTRRSCGNARKMQVGPN